MFALSLYLIALVLFALSLPEVFLDPHSQQFIFILGTVGIWRYSWGGMHFIRSIVYRKKVFPCWRRKTELLGDAALPGHVYLLLTSFRISTETSLRVYREALLEAIRCNRPVTLVASIVEMADERLIRAIYRSLNPPQRVRLCIVRIPGTGKRDALASGFIAIKRRQPPPDAAVAVIDGDSILTPGSINHCASILAIRPEVGALTTDEVCELEGEYYSTGIYRRWYSMRFAQRHILMSSMGLARRVLTLTGRMSMFRASIVTEPEFIATVQRDHIDHWRLGRFSFLTGDDKSSWYHLLKHGWEMAYVPDVQIITIEEPPHRNFFTGATMLMMRWFGNMLRTNSRALTVPRKTTGNFMRWCLIDQRLSMWTSLFGLTAALIGSLLNGIDILIVYAFWIGFTRFLQTLMLWNAHPQISASYPFFLYFNQIYGSLVKIYMLAHLNRQKWTRQKTTLNSGTSGIQLRFQQLLSNAVLITSLLVLFHLVGFLGGLYHWGDIHHFWSAFF